MKKRSRFAPWQEANQQRREVLIDDYLRYLRTSRLRPRNATDLADLVAKYIEAEEGAPCDKSTLLRNSRYRAKILPYYAQHFGADSRTQARHRLTDPASTALLTTKKLEASNLKREVERQNIYIRSLEEDLDKTQRRDPLRPPEPLALESSQTGASEISDFEFKFLRTCQALRALLSHMNVVLEVDTRAQQILDKSKRRNNVIVDKEIAGPFIEWLTSMPGGIK